MMIDATPYDLRRLCLLVSGRAMASEIAEQDWAGMIRLARQHGLESMLYYVLRQSKCLLTLPRREAHSLAALHLQVAGRNSLAYAAVREWSVRFRDGGIKALWLKGAAMGLLVYPNPSLRAMVDIDVLIGAQQIVAARSLVEQVTGRKTSSLAHDVHRHATARVGKQGTIQLELHWSLVDLAVGPGGEDAGWFMDQWAVVDSEGVEVGTLTPEAHLLHLCAHAQIIHGDEFRLGRYLDLHLLIGQYPVLDWDLILERAAAFGWSYAVERALSLTQEYFATPLPDGLLAELQARRPANENLFRVTGHDNVDSRGARLLNRVAWLPWRARARYIIAFAFPSPTYMRSRYRLANGWQVPFYYLYRWLDVAGEVVKTLGRRSQRRR